MPTPSSLPLRFAFVLACALGGAGCGGGAADERPLSALVVSLDTTIPEMLHCYRAAEGVSPNIDALAEQGILYENARTVTPMTLPSHASMLTGLYPPRHTVRMNGSMVLPEEASTLAERARERGYRTSAFIAAVVLNKEFGLAQGFEVYDEPAPPADLNVPFAGRRRGAAVADRAIEWFEQLEDEDPFFSWVHFFDPHAPYDPPPEYLNSPMNPRRNPYRGELAYMDAQIGRVFDALQRTGRWEDTIVVVVADHGEGLGRKGEGTHATFGFDTTLDIPLIVRHPDGRRAGERALDIVSIVDVFPTLVNALEFGAPGDVDGYDLLAAGIPADRGVYFETYFGFISFGWSHLTGWADARGKYIHSSSPEFYDMRTDPLENTNLIEERARDVERYRNEIARLASRTRLELAGTGGDAFGELASRIEALGYAGAGTEASELPEPLAPSEAFSPHQRIATHEAFLTAQRLCGQGKSREAIPILERIWNENPRNHNASFVLGVALLENDRPAEAIAPLAATTVNRGGDWIGGWLNLGVAHERVGNSREAIDAYERAFENDIGPPGAMQRLIRLLRAGGEEEKAMEYEARLREAGRLPE